MPANKSELRAQFRAARGQLDFTLTEKAVAKATATFLEHPLFQQHEFIACYFPLKDEFDSQPLIHAINAAGKHCYLPIIRDDKTLAFARYKEGDAMQLNEYAILEPRNTIRMIAPEHLHVVLLPLIAFDNKGNRLGTGGGYYDKTFAFLNRQIQRMPKMVGIGFASQEAASIPSEDWDVRMDAVVTENGVREF